jgi:hypothetical protein
MRRIWGLDMVVSGSNGCVLGGCACLRWLVRRRCKTEVERGCWIWPLQGVEGCRRRSRRGQFHGRVTGKRNEGFFAGLDASYRRMRWGDLADRLVVMALGAQPGICDPLCLERVSVRRRVIYFSRLTRAMTRKLMSAGMTPPL